MKNSAPDPSASSAPALVGRRTVLAGLGAAVGGGAGVMALNTIGVQEGMAANLTAGNVEITSDDGSVTTLTLEPDITVTWAGLDVKPATVGLTLTVEDVATATTHTFATENPSVQTTETSNDTGDLFNMAKYSILGGTPFADTAFNATSDGGTSTKDVEVQVEVDLKDGSGTVLTSDIAGPATYTVTVNNITKTVSASGVANTNGS